MRKPHPSPGRPLLAAAVRPWAGLLMATCAVLLVVLGVVFAHQTAAPGLDRAIDDPVITWFGRHPGLAGSLARPGSLVPMAALSVVTAVACLLARRLNGAVLAMTAVPVAAGLNDGLLKHLFDRTYLGVLTYPSGHTATVFALAAAVVILLFASPPQAGPEPASTEPTRTGSARTRPLRVLLAAAACTLGVVVALGVMGLEWHYFTDTVGGAALGIGTACGLAFVLDLPVVARPLARADRLWPTTQANARV